MLWKLITLALVAYWIWKLTRPRPPSATQKKEQKKTETPLQQCSQCGVYHVAGEQCKCQK